MTATPSPQSVVSDRALEQIAFNLCSLHDFPVDFVKANERFARSVITEYLRAAPAPSSLAGGEVDIEFAPNFGFETNEPSLRQIIEFYYRSHGMENWPKLAAQYCAALSPEAPAREGGWIEAAKRPDTTGDLWLAVDAAGKLFPGVFVNHRIPTEAALVQRIMLPGRDALTPRSSASEALGNLLAVIHGDGGHRALEVGTKQAALEAEKIVANLLSSAPEAREGEAWSGRGKCDCSDDTGLCPKCFPDAPMGTTHPAAPIADKLREVLIDLTSWFTKPVQGQNGMVWVIRAGEMGADDALNAALAALKGDA